MTFQYTVIIPTLNAAEQIRGLLEALRAQAHPPKEIIVVDSQSDDETVSIAEAFDNVRILSVEREQFDHGGTRDFAVRASATPFVVLMCQDALPIDPDCMRALLAPFEDGRVAAVCARQVARPDAPARERAIRAFRYPDSSLRWTGEDIARLGIRAFLLSDTCTAYRRSAYDAVGGFTHPIATDEDMLIAADLLDAGYALSYRADARVWHSHDHTLVQEFRRNRRIGLFMAEYGHRFRCGGEMNEGVRLVREVSAQLLRHGRVASWLRFAADCGARFLGNRAGKRDYRKGKDK